MKGARIDLTGRTYGRLTVLRRAGERRFPGGQTQALWLTRCECGREHVVPGPCLRNRNTRSCGCLGLESRRKAGRANRRKVVTYYGAHARLRRERGPAKSHACSDCGEPARSWSYDHNDDHELVEVVRGYAVAYSVDPAHYVPRCHSCHGVFDKARRRSSHRGAA